MSFTCWNCGNPNPVCDCQDKLDDLDCLYRKEREIHRVLESIQNEIKDRLLELGLPLYPGVK